MTRDQRDSTTTNQNQQERQSGKDMASWKPGSDAASAKDVAGKGDFGVPAGNEPSRDRDYVSENTKRSDPGNAMPRSGEDEGLRTTGAGANAAGDGSGSGGDLDPDFIGVGTGTGMSISAPGGRVGADASDGTSAEMASGRPAKGENQTGVHHVGGAKRIRGTTFDRSRGDAASSGDGQGADAVTNPMARDDDSFAAEISGGEAAGDDNAMPPGPDDPGVTRDDA